jgi:hypothetical protein
MAKYPPFYNGWWDGKVIQVNEVLSLNRRTIGFSTCTDATPSDVVAKVRDILEGKNSSNMNLYKQYFKEWENKSILEKIVGYWQYKNVLKNYNAELLENEEKKKSPVQFTYINKEKEYIFPCGDKKNGDSVYGYVTSESNLPIGFYEGKIKEVFYEIVEKDNKVFFYPNGDYICRVNGEDVWLPFRSDERGLYCGFVNNEMFFDKQEALTKYEEFTESQKQFYEIESQKAKIEKQKMKI